MGRIVMGLGTNNISPAFLWRAGYNQAPDSAPPSSSLFLFLFLFSNPTPFRPTLQLFQPTLPPPPKPTPLNRTTNPVPSKPSHPANPPTVRTQQSGIEEAVDRCDESNGDQDITRLGQSFTLGLWEWLYIDGVLPLLFFFGDCMDIESGNERREGRGGGWGW